MSIIRPVRQAMAAALTGVGIRPFAYVKDSITPPCAALDLSAFGYDQTFGRNLHRLDFTVRIYASRASDRAGQDVIDDLIDPTVARSVHAALDGSTLGGLVETTRVSEMNNYGVYTVGGVDYFGAEITVTVHARST